MIKENTATDDKMQTTGMCPLTGRGCVIDESQPGRMP
jgi:hypothetical protein